MRLPVLLVSAMLWLSACSGAPSVPQAVPVAVPTCPAIPASQRLPADVLEPSFTDRMDYFLRGKLPAQK